MKKPWILFSLLGILIFSLQACRDGASSRGAPGPNDTIHTVSLASLSRREVPHNLNLRGDFEASQVASLKSQSSGKVLSLSVTEGQNLFSGEVIAKIEDDKKPYVLERQRAALREAEAQLELDNRLSGDLGGNDLPLEEEEDVEVPDFNDALSQGLREGFEEGAPEEANFDEENQDLDNEDFEEEALGADEEEEEEEFIEDEIPEDESPQERLARLRKRAAAARARIQRERQRRASQQARQNRNPKGGNPNPGIVTPTESKEVLESRENLNQARIERIRAEIALSEKELEGATLLAPIDGMVRLVHSFEGALVKVGDPLVDLVNIDPIVLKTFVAKEEIDKVNKEKRTQVRIPDLGEELFEGEITYIAPGLSEDKKSVEVRIALSNPELRIKAGMLGEVDFPVSDSSYEAIMAPKEAIFFESGKAYVYRVQGQVALKSLVTLGSRLENLIEIRKGLEPEDQVVLEGLDQLKKKEEFIRTRSSSPK